MADLVDVCPMHSLQILLAGAAILFSLGDVHLDDVNICLQLHDIEMSDVAADVLILLHNSLNVIHAIAPSFQLRQSLSGN